jgi:predicted nucleic acid-binding protein
MRIPRVYADTSVFGGVFDEEFEQASRAFFEQVRRGRFQLVTSALVELEIALAPAAVRELFDDMLLLAERVDVSDEAARLQQAYVDAGVVPPSVAADALHVALAVVAGCTIIVSWNFRHIVHFQRIPLYNAVNTLNGFAGIAIFSPLEMIEDEEGEDV